MPDSLVTLHIDDRVALLTLNRPEAMNALSAALRDQLTEHLKALRDNDDVGVVILTGGGRAFCAGLDLPELMLAGNEVAGEGVIGQAMLDAIDALTCPIIGAINGFAITGGLELALCCDVLIASSRAEFADTHASVGIVPAWGVTQKLPRIIGPLRAKEMSLSARRISAQQAYEWGLVNRVVDHQNLLPECYRLAHAMTACNADAQSRIKALIDSCWGDALAEGLKEEKRISTEVFAEFAKPQDSD